MNRAGGQRATVLAVLTIAALARRSGGACRGLPQGTWTTTRPTSLGREAQIRCRSTPHDAHQPRPPLPGCRCPHDHGGVTLPDPVALTMAPRLDIVADAYRAALADARRRPTWRLRRRARRWREVVVAGSLDDFEMAHLAALRRELLDRAVAELPPNRVPR